MFSHAWEAFLCPSLSRHILWLLVVAVLGMAAAFESPG